MNQRQRIKAIKVVTDRISGFLSVSLANTQASRPLYAESEPFASIYVGNGPAITLSFWGNEFTVAFSRYVTLFVSSDDLIDKVNREVVACFGSGNVLLKGGTKTKIVYSIGNIIE